MDDYLDYLVRLMETKVKNIRNDLNNREEGLTYLEVRTLKMVCVKFMEYIERRIER